MEKKKLLYFEEYDSDLSYALRQRKDIDVFFIRNVKSYKYFNREYLDKYKNNFYTFQNSSDEEIRVFKENYMKYHNLKFDYFLNDSEYYMDFANKVARSLDLESLSEEQVRWVRDKVAMKDRFNQIGLKTVDYQVVTSKKEILEFMKKHIGEPIIFKPRDLMNSKDVYKINNVKELDQIDLDLSSEKYMVESYCNDQEWSIESLVQDGIVLDSYVTYIPNRTLWAAMDNKLNCHMTVPKLPSYFKFNPKEFIQTIVDGMNLKNGAMTIEVFIDKEGNIMPSELGWRLPGCQATKNHSRSYGFDMIDTLIDIAVHNKVTMKYKDSITSVGDLYLPNKTGLITKITPLDKLLSMPSVIDGELFVKEGDVRKKRRVGNDASGWVQVEGKDEFETLEKMQNVYDNFIIEATNEGGKKYVKTLK